MANFKRKKSRRQVRCSMCTDARHGNATGQGGKSPKAELVARTKSQRKKEAEREIE